MALDFNMMQQGTGTPLPRQPSGTSQVMSSLEQVIGANSPYIANARRRGLEVAATRGGINSSIAAGSSERSALEAAMPLVQQGLGIDNQQRDVEYNNWLSEQNFGRALFGQQFSNSLGMLNQLQQYAMEDPELYTPDITSGFSNFFQQQTSDILKRYFGAPQPTV